MLFTAVFEFEAGAELTTLLVLELWVGCVTGGTGRTCETIGPGVDCVGTFVELCTLGDCGASLGEIVEVDRLGAGALHDLGVGADCELRAASSEPSDVGGAVAA